MPDLITLNLEAPTDAATEEPDGAASTPDAARPLPPAVLENLETPAASPGFPRPATAAEQPYALTEVGGDPELDPSTPNQPGTALPAASQLGPLQPGAPSAPTASPSAKVGSSAPTSPTPPASIPITARSLSPSAHVHVHKARLQDARNIFDLVNSLSHDGTLLRRSYAEICENIRDFTVAETIPEASPDHSDTPGSTPAAAPHFLGCGALHLYGPHLAEVRSIVLHPEARGQGAGGAILRALLAESEDHGVATTCLFTRIPDFFFHYGFRVAERSAMPDKIYKDCQTCPRLYACDEVAMVKGPLPQTAVLGPKTIQQPELVQVQLHPVLTSQPHS